MKKALICLMCALLMLPCVTGCREISAADALEMSDKDVTMVEALETSGKDVTMAEEQNAFPKKLPIRACSVSMTAINVTPTGLTLHVYRGETEENIGTLYLNSGLILERCVDETQPILTWETVPVNGSDSLPLTVQALDGQDKTVIEVNWETLYGTLPPGGYRMLRQVEAHTDTGEVYGQNIYTLFNIPEEPFVGRGLTLADVPAEKMPYASPLVAYELRITAKDVTPFGATLHFSLVTGGGYGFYLERFDGDEWQRMPYLPVGPIERAFPAVAIVIREPMSVDWSHLYGELEPGVYRLAKKLESWERYADYFAYFEIVE